jgi:hypothetical protein
MANKPHGKWDAEDTMRVVDISVTRGNVGSNEVTVRIRAVLEKLTVAKLVKKCTAVYEPER